MPKASPIITSFNAGEFSGLLLGRVDLKYYGNGCRRMRNFIPTRQGPAVYRGAFRYVAGVKTHADRSWLWRFEFNVEQAYVLEFGDLYIRFFSNHGVVESSPGVPLEVVSPWSVSDLTDSAGTFNLRFVQSGDTVYICHPNYAPRKLMRTGAAAFSLSTIATVGGPFKDVDPDNTITVYASASTGTGITLTASSAIFTSDHIGTPFYLEQRNTDDIKQWESGKSISVNDLRRSDGKNYKALNAATTGSVKPVHSVGSKYDGDSGVQWSFQDPGYGYATITAIGGGGTTATADVVKQLPYGCVLVGQATTRWAFSAWSDAEGWPTHVTFFRERLVFLRGQDGWTSVSGDFENFSRKDDSGLVTADMSIVFTLESDRSNRIEWAAPSDVALLIGTAGDEHALLEITSTEPFGPSNARALKQSEYGARHVPEVRVGEGVLFVQKSGRKFRDMTLAESVNERWTANDVTILAEHITKTGIITAAYQQEPDSVVWAACSDGRLIGFTFDRTQDVKGWHQHPVGGSFGSGNPIVESVVAIPSPDGDRDELWAIIKRTIDGSTVRYVEYMERYHEEGDDPLYDFYLDSGLTYDGVPATTISGLDHLEGQTVGILADGSVHPTKVVTAGEIELDYEASVVHIGLKYRGVLSPMPTEAGAADGTARGKTQRINKLGIKMLETGGIKIGRDEDSTLDQIPFRSLNDLMDAPVPLFTGERVVSWPDGYMGEGVITIVQDSPLPACIVALMPHITTQDTAGSK